jgi:hypothetical protein
MRTGQGKAVYIFFVFLLSFDDPQAEGFYIHLAKPAQNLYTFLTICFQNCKESATEYSFKNSFLSNFHEISPKKKKNACCC